MTIKVPDYIRQHPEFKTYYVSRDGEGIYRTPGKLDVNHRYGAPNEWGLIKLNFGLQGNKKDPKYQYYCVNISHYDENGKYVKQTTRSVHLMVADCWMRPPLPGEEICHGPKGSRCNHVENLRWGSHLSNMSEIRGRKYRRSKNVSRRSKNNGVGNLSSLINEV